MSGLKEGDCLVNYDLNKSWERQIWGEWNQKENIIQCKNIIKYKVLDKKTSSYGGSEIFMYGWTDKLWM